MKLTLVIAEVFIISLFSIICLNGLGEIKKLSDQVEKTGKTYDSQRFIYESFKKTCEGKGFSCLLDWQNYCRNNWKLDYIGFSEAEEFCNDFQLNSKGEVLMYGKWKGPYGEGEVYCIKK